MEQSAISQGDFDFVQTYGPCDRPSLVRLTNLQAFLREKVRGQEYVTARLSLALQRSELGLSKRGRPRGSFLFLGPTGVGKTEATLAFTSYLIGADALFRFDMSEYQMQESLGGLIDAVSSICRITNRGTLLFDEIEKAHPRIFDVFLQILDAARLTTAEGTTHDLSGFYVVFTTNLASSEVLNLEHSAFATMERHVLARAQQHMRPELYARIGEKLVFSKLDYEVLLQIALDFIAREVEFLQSRGHRLAVAPDVLPFLVQKGYHSKLGARPMRDAVERYIGEAVVRDVLAGGAGCGRLAVETGEERLRVEREPETLQQP